MENFNKFKLIKMYFRVFRKSGIIFFTFTAITAALCSCHFYSTEEEKIAETAEAFGNHLFNYELKEAAAMTTNDGRKWIMLLASNVDSATVSTIRNQDEAATVDVVNLSITSDTTATVELTASNFVWAKDLEVNPEVTDEMRFFFNMVKRGNKWLIRMDNLLQSGK